MRANTLILIGLITIQCVATMKSQFSLEYQDNPQFKSLVDDAKKTNLGSLIMQLAEVRKGNKFVPLFDAIDGVTTFLNKQQLNENTDYAQASSQYNLDMVSVKAQLNSADNSYKSKQSFLQATLIPQKSRDIKQIKTLKKNGALFQKQRINLIQNRQKQVAAFKKESENFRQGVDALNQAIPVVRTLLNDQSFLEINADQVNQVSFNLNNAFKNNKINGFYQVFVQTFLQTFDKKNIGNHHILQKALVLLEDLLKRLQEDQRKLLIDESGDKKLFGQQLILLDTSIKQIHTGLQVDKKKLKYSVLNIASTKKKSAVQKKLFVTAEESLKNTQIDFVKRTKQHDIILTDIQKELVLITQAVHVLSVGGITRYS